MLSILRYFTADACYRLSSGRGISSSATDVMANTYGNQRCTHSVKMCLLDVRWKCEFANANPNCVQMEFNHFVGQILEVEL